MFEIHGTRECYRVNDQGEISRRCLDWKFSGGWKALALVRRCNFGTVEVIPFAQWRERLPNIQWTFKNGKPRYTLRDLDHGTVREWGEMVYRVRRMASSESVLDRAEAYAKRVQANPGNWGVQ